MKSKYLVLGIGALLAAGALWFGRSSWRARHQLVSLNVHQVPLAEVLRKVERQTGKKIRAESSLDARITLNVVDQPLSYVMDRLANQAGATWSTLYAVYSSPPALSALEAALIGNGKLGPAGWDKIAPNLPKLDLPGAGEFHELPQPGPNPVMIPLDSKSLPGGVRIATEDVTVGAPAGAKPETMGPGPGAGSHRPMMIRIRKQAGNADSTDVVEDVWTPEELVLESGLSVKLDKERANEASAEAAAKIAQSVGGRWTTLLAMSRSPLGMDLGGSFGPRLGSQGPRIRIRRGPVGQSETNLDRLLEPGGAGQIDLEAAAVADQRNDPFANLTPQQRVLRARARAGATEK
jgi:hypothetical protein